MLFIYYSLAAAVIPTVRKFEIIISVMRIKIVEKPKTVSPL